MQPLVNTDLLPPGGTLTLAFVPTTPGNWLFHCHFSFHLNDETSLVGAPRDSMESAAADVNHASKPSSEHHMRGLVIGIHVKPSPGWIAYSASPSARTIRLLVQRKSRGLLNGMATERTANVELGPGETADFELRPARPESGDSRSRPLIPVGTFLCRSL